jgi:predicted nucleic acid-binding protein
VLLLDNSAWARLMQGIVPKERAETIAAWMDRGEVAVSLPFLLEAGYSARSAADRTALMARLDRLPRVIIDREVERLALQAQQELADVGHHRLAPPDVMIAACAHRAEAGVLHYDGDYDVLSERTSLVFDSEWLAPPGSLQASQRAGSTACRSSVADSVEL